MLGREGHGSHDSALETLSGGSDGAMRGARVPRDISRLFEGVGISLLTWTSEFFSISIGPFVAASRRRPLEREPARVAPRGVGAP